MSIFVYFIISCWFIFYAYWLVAARGVKRNISGHSIWKNLILRLGIILTLLLLAHTSIFAHVFQHEFKNYFQQMQYATLASSYTILNSIGCLLTAAGVACAVWARIHLGRNWGMPMSIKEKPELITSGPYTYVRHPIYTGMLVGILGSAFVIGVFWIFFVISGIYFFYSLTEEEKLMTKQFPLTYLAYKKRTKKLIPLIY